jgi:hypothetical protein
VSCSTSNLNVCLTCNSPYTLNEGTGTCSLSCPAYC